MAIHSIVPRGSARRVPALFGSHGLDRLFDELRGGFDAVAAPSAFTPHVDVRETEEGLRLTAELPGLEEGDFSLSVENGVITLEGEKKTERKDEGERYQLVERTHGSFARAFRIPFEFKSEDVTAGFANGVLAITVPRPKDSPTRVRTIPVTNS